MPDNNEKERLNIHLDDEIIQILKDIALKENKDIIYIIELFIKIGIEQYIKNENTSKKSKPEVKIISNLEKKVIQSIERYNKEINNLNDNKDKIYILENIEEQIEEFEKKIKKQRK